MTRKTLIERARANPDLNRWFLNLSRGSAITAEVYVRRLTRVCKLLDTTPEGLVEEAGRDSKAFQDSLEDMVTELEADKKSPGYIRGLLKSSRSWLRYNDITLTRKIKVSNPSATPTIEDEMIPSKDDLSLTRQLVFACRLMGIIVHEHLVIGDNRYFSFADQGHIAQMNGEYELNMK